MCLEKNFSTKHLNYISTDAHIDHSVTLPGCAHKNPARSFHFNSLLDQNSFVALGYTICYHPCACASRRRPGCGVFAVVKHHASMESCGFIERFPRNEIKKFSAGTIQVICRTFIVHLQSAHRL